MRLLRRQPTAPSHGGVPEQVTSGETPTREGFFHGSFFRSIRFRLALWFALALALVLLIFSAFVYYRTVQDVREQTATRLVVRLRDMNAAFLRSFRYYEVWGWWRSENGANGSGAAGASREIIPLGGEPFALQESEVVVVSDPSGAAAGEWGAITDPDAALVAAMTEEWGDGSKGGRFFFYDITPEGSARVTYLFSALPVLYQNQLLGWVIMGRPLDPARQLPALRLTLIIAVTATLLAAVAGGAWLAGRALWPVKAITRAAREISETDLSRRLNIRTRDELGELAGTFDAMLERLQAAFSRQRQFTADASHELRTPLTIIGLETSRALEVRRSAEEYQRTLRVIQSENEFMSRLVNELLTLARIDAGQLELKREPLDLSDVALEVVERFAALAAQKNIALLAGDLPELPVLGDRTYLMQMIGNLVENAIKYSPPGSSVQVDTGLDGAFAWTQVRDTGPGIAPEHLPHLFERFYRADTARSHNPGEETEAIPSSGLGLSIVQQIARIHGGSVQVESQSGEGSAFTVRLPIGGASLPQEPESAPASQPEQ